MMTKNITAYFTASEPLTTSNLDSIDFLPESHNEISLYNRMILVGLLWMAVHNGKKIGEGLWRIEAKRKNLFFVSCKIRNF